MEADAASFNTSQEIDPAQKIKVSNVERTGDALPGAPSGCTVHRQLCLQNTGTTIHA